MLSGHLSQAHPIHRIPLGTAVQGSAPAYLWTSYILSFFARLTRYRILMGKQNQLQRLGRAVVMAGFGYGRLPPEVSRVDWFQACLSSRLV